jgi:hypothetical protein
MSFVRVKNRFVFLIPTGIVVILSLIPFRTTSVPQWEVQVEDINGQPLTNAPVRQEWSHSEMLAASSQTLQSDENGMVIFPARYFYAPLLFRLVLKVFEYGNSVAMPEGSRIGVYSRIICESGTYYWLEYHNGKELEHKLVVKKL